MKKNAFSLVELLVFVSILSIFFIMAASVVTVSLRNMKFNENKLKATHYASQLEEWLKIQKEVNWGGQICGSCSNPVSFTEIVTQSAGSVFCFNNTLIDDWVNPGTCTDYDLDSIFKREVSFTPILNAGYIAEVSAVITVSWTDISNKIRSVSTNTLFSVSE